MADFVLDGRNLALGSMCWSGVIPAMTSVDDGYSSQEGLEEVQRLGVKVVSISGAKGKKPSRRSNGRAGLTDRRGPSAARSSPWFSL
jgi:hypothetical protein